MDSAFDFDAEKSMKRAGSSIDRRVARTRATLQHALMSLIPKKSYEAITVEDICHAANVGRSTFYAHYAGKDDLKRSGLENLRRQLADCQRRALEGHGDIGDRRLAFSLPMFEHARDHHHVYRALAGSRGGTVALGKLRQILCDLVRAELATMDEHSADAVPRELAVQYVVGAYLALLTWWLDAGAKLSPQRMDAVFRRLATEGIASSSS
jgi:AcrR family transcriptional regulator